VIVATAGHIDHGKTALVRALTGVDTDRLPEEKARGISIDLGFAYLRLPGGAIIGFVDVPGHERFVRNMLAGVCGIDYVMLVVAADDGVMPQTVEHLKIMELLSVKHGIAVVTKTDRVAAGRAAEVGAAVRALLAPTALSAIDVLPVSSVSGVGLEALRAALAAAVSSIAREEQAGRLCRYAVDRVFSVAGSGTVVTGTVFDGALSAGDRLVLSPAGIEVRVRGVQKDRKGAERAEAGERCALNLAGIGHTDAKRGDWILSPALHAPSQRLDVQVRLLASETRPLRHWTPVHLHHGACDMTVRVAIRRGAEIAPGESGHAHLVVDRPIAALNGDRFILRDQSALRTIGGGLVLDPSAPLHQRNHKQRAAQLAALEQRDPAQALGALLECTTAGIDLDWFARIYNLHEDRLAALIQSGERILLGKEPRICLPRATVEAVKAGVRQTLAQFHAAAPQALGMELAELRKHCAPGYTVRTFTTLLRSLADERYIELSGSVARLARHVATDNPADEKLWISVRPALESAAFNGMTLAELASAVASKEQPLRDFMHRKAKTGDLVRVTAERFFLRETLARFAAIAQAVSRSVPGGKFSAAQVRDRSGIGRTRAIEILECLDRLGITQRVGDLRVMRKDYEPILGTPRQQH